MAKELSRSFDHARAAVIVRIEQFDGGPVEVHTLYLAQPGGCPSCGHRAPAMTGLDIDAEIHARVREAEARRFQLETAMRRAGWQG